MFNNPYIACSNQRNTNCNQVNRRICIDEKHDIEQNPVL